jgi:hypothetical protein
MELGVMRFRFVDASRAQVRSLWWEDELIANQDADVKIMSVTEASTPGELALEAHKAEVAVLLRPEQKEFRRRLDLAYGYRCCISGCTVPMALEAAHIIPFRKSRFDSPTNGLLLRRDLQALFYSGQVAIHPKSRRVFFSKEAQAWNEYQKLHGRPLAKPQPGRQNDAPNATALRVRWKQFARSKQG